MEPYKKAVETLAKASSNYLFNNSSHEHAAIVLATMINHTQKELRIYDDNLSGDIADKNEEFYQNLDKFIYAGKQLSIVVDKIEDRNNRLMKTLSDLKSKFPSAVKIAITSEVFKTEIKNIFNKNINFALSDNKAFRIEEIKDESENTRKAIVCFNDTKNTTKILTVFDAYLNTCQPLT